MLGVNANSQFNSWIGKPPVAGTAEAITRVGQHTAEAQARSAHTIDLGQRNLRLGAVGAHVIGNPGAIEAGRIARPTLGQKQPQSHHHRDFTKRQRQRHQRLAVGVLWDCPGFVDTKVAFA